MGIMGFAEIMDSGIEILRKYLKTIIFYNIGIGIIAFISLFIFIFLSFMLLIPGTMYGNSGGIYVLLFIIVVGVLSIILSLNAGIMKISGQYYGEKPAYAYDAIRVAVKKLPLILGLVTLVALVFIPMAAAAITMFKELSISINTGLAEPMGTGNILQLLSILALVILFALITIGYLTLFSFSLQAITLENLGPVEAIKRSYHLLKGGYIRLVGYNLLIFGSVYAINLSFEGFLGLIISILFMILRFLNVQQEYLLFFSSIYAQLQWPITILSWLIITPISSIILTVLYYNQRFVKEGYDISLKLREIKEKLKG